MPTQQTLRELTAAVDRLHERLDKVATTFVDETLRLRLGSLRSHLSTAAMLLRQPTNENLARVGAKIEDVTQQLEAIISSPDSAMRGPYQQR